MKRRIFLNQTASLVGVSSLGHLSATGVLSACSGGSTQPVIQKNQYKQVNLVATHASYKPLILEPKIIDAWGIAIRPAGAGGHFWVTGEGYSFEYVGDVNGVPLSQDTLKEITLPNAGNGLGIATGTVFNPTNGFTVTNAHANGPITAPAKFLFATDSGSISAWTERNNAAAPQGKDWPTAAELVIDGSGYGGAFFGLAVVESSKQLLVADFGSDPKIRVFDSTFKEITSTGFANPFGTGPSGKVVPGDYVPFNVTTIMLAGAETVFVTYAKSKPDETDPTLFYAAEEDSANGHGRLVQFSPSGMQIAIWAHEGRLNSPWGLTLAPKNYGSLSNHLLVGNFGSGTIAAFDVITRKSVDYLKDAKDKPVVIEGLWALLFGNGVSLGDSNALYFAAGPADETEGLFGALRVV